MRGKKRKVLTQEQRKIVREFEKWCKEEIEKDFIEQIRNYNPVEDILNGVGTPQTIIGLTDDVSQKKMIEMFNHKI